MRHAKAVVLLSLLALTVSSFNEAEAASLVGKPCAKVGVNSGDGPGRTVVCVKLTSGKDKGKRRWRLLNFAAPSAGPTKSPAPTSTDVSTATSSPTAVPTTAPTSPCTRPTFTHDLISLDSVQVVVPIGQQTAFGGVLSVRSYVHTKPELQGQQLPVVAPTDMTLTSGAYYRPPDAPADYAAEYSLFFDAGCGVEVQLYHIKGVVGPIADVMPKVPVPSSAGQQVTPTKIRAGEQIGWFKSGGTSVAFDFRVEDSSHINSFINEKRFMDAPMARGELHAICPYSLYVGAQRERWLARLGAPSSQPVPGTECGTITQGTRATAQGMWFFPDAKVNETTFRGLTWDQGVPGGQYQSQILLTVDALGNVRLGGLNAAQPMSQLILGKQNPTWKDPLTILGGQEHCWRQDARSVKIRLSADGNTLTAVVGTGACESLRITDGVEYVR